MFLFELHRAGHRTHEVRDQIVPPFQLDVDLLPRVRHLILLADQPIVGAYHPQHHEDDYNQEHDENHGRLGVRAVALGDEPFDYTVTSDAAVSGPQSDRSAAEYTTDRAPPDAWSSRRSEQPASGPDYRDWPDLGVSARGLPIPNRSNTQVIGMMNNGVRSWPSNRFTHVSAM